MGREEEISKIAYHMWDLEGRPEGHSLEYWLLAESIWEINHQPKQQEADNKAESKVKSEDSFTS